VVLDLREAMLADLHTVLYATLIAGRLTVLAPAEVTVTVTQARLPGRSGRGAGPLPGVRRAPAAAAAPPGAPVIEIRAFTVAGRVRVLTPRRAGNRWLGGFRRRDR
jgi:hypothetical protein